MEKTNLLTLVVTLTVGIILAGSLLMPVLGDVTTTEKTFSNETGALGYVQEIGESSDYTFAWTPGTTKITVNGEDVDLVNNETVICKADDCMVRYTNGYFQYWATTLTTIGGPTQPFDLSITDGVMTISGNDITTITKSVVGGYMLAGSGDYVMKSSTQAAYMLDDSPILAMGVTTMTGNVNVALTIEGTPESVTISKIYPTGVDYTFTDVAISKTTVDGYNDLTQVSKITFVATDESNNVTDCTYSYFIVPAKVTAELTQHLDAGEIALLTALPILVIIGLVMAGVGAIFVRNRD